jgi:hypothetical protein
MVPPYWFGGSWLTAQIMNDVSWQEMRLPYLLTLGAVYISIMIAPASRLIVRVCRKI